MRFTPEVDAGSIVNMRDVMIKRGPDDAGMYIAPHIGLGHRRLSIIDLSSSGHQPLKNEDGKIWIVFNGEIYNFFELRESLINKGHVFCSKTDTEVLVHGYEEWGIEGLVRKINGMYAFALWDATKEELVLVRDRLGIKPLFYMENGGGVFFSSDIKSIYLVSDGELSINFEAIDHFLYAYCIPQEHSIFREIKKVPPAHYIIFSKKETVSKRYWKISFARKLIMTENEYIEALEEKLTASVRRRMISDVPLGAFLSGGVDSSIIVALMSKITNSQVKTFSMGVKEESYNELKYARMVAEKYSTDHHEFILEPDALGILPEIIWNYGEPFADSSQIPTYYVAKMTREYVTVALTGDGGDESFAGYSNFSAYYFGSLYRKYLPVLLASKLLPQLANSLVSLLGKRGIVSKFKTLTTFGSDNFVDSLRDGGIFDFDHRNKLYSPELKEKLLAHDTIDIYENYILSADGIDNVDKALYLGIMTSLPNDYLTKVDVATMMNSLEARSPYLDVDLMEFAAMIPSNIKLKNGRPKYLLKKLAGRLIPREAVFRKKWGFGIPIGLWFRGDLGSFMKKILLSDRALERGYFNAVYVKTLLDDHLDGKCDHSHRLWTMLCLELWHLMFIDKVITARTDWMDNMLRMD